MDSLHSYKRPLRLICCCSSLGLLILAVGCGGTPHSVNTAEVSGKVLFQGKPLPGGRVAFVAVNGGFPSSGIINEDGTYQIKAPIGDVQISVDNRMLSRQGLGSGGKGGKGSVGGPPQKMSHPRSPGADEPKEQPIKGKYVPIPAQYADPGTSGLTFTVKSGSQTHDIELSASSPSVAAGH